MSENGIILLIYNKPDIAIEKDKHVNRKMSKRHEKEIHDRRKIKRAKPNKKVQLH